MSDRDHYLHGSEDVKTGASWFSGAVSEFRIYVGWFAEAISSHNSVLQEHTLALRENTAALREHTEALRATLATPQAGEK